MRENYILSQHKLQVFDCVVEGDEGAQHDPDFYVAKRPFGSYAHDASKGSIGSNLDVLQGGDEFDKRLFKFGKRPFGSGTYKFGKRQPAEADDQMAEGAESRPFAGDWNAPDAEKRRAFKFGRRGADRRTVYFGKRGDQEKAEEWEQTAENDLYDRMQRAPMFKFGKRQP